MGWNIFDPLGINDKIKEEFKNQMKFLWASTGFQGFDGIIDQFKEHSEFYASVLGIEDEWVTAGAAGAVPLFDEDREYTKMNDFILQATFMDTPLTDVLMDLVVTGSYATNQYYAYNYAHDNHYVHGLPTIELTTRIVQSGREVERGYNRTAGNLGIMPIIPIVRTKKWLYEELKTPSSAGFAEAENIAAMTRRMNLPFETFCEEMHDKYRDDNADALTDISDIFFTFGISMDNSKLKAVEREGSDAYLYEFFTALPTWAVNEPAAGTEQTGMIRKVFMVEGPTVEVPATATVLEDSIAFGYAKRIGRFRFTAITNTPVYLSTVPSKRDLFNQYFGLSVTQAEFDDPTNWKTTATRSLTLANSIQWESSGTVFAVEVATYKEWILPNTDRITLSGSFKQVLPPAAVAPTLPDGTTYVLKMTEDRYVSSLIVGSKKVTTQHNVDIDAQIKSLEATIVKLEATIAGGGAYPPNYQGPGTGTGWDYVKNQITQYKNSIELLRSMQTAHYTSQASSSGLTLKKYDPKLKTIRQMVLKDVATISYLVYYNEKEKKDYKLTCAGSPTDGLNIIPLSTKVMATLAPWHREAVFRRSLHLITYSSTQTKVRYYQTKKFAKYFKIVVIIVAIILAIPSGGASIKWGAVMFEIMSNYVISQLVMVAIKFLVKAALSSGNKLFLALAVVVAVAASIYSGNAPDKWALDAIKIVNAVSAVMGVQAQYENGKFLIDMKANTEFLEGIEEDTERVQEQIDALTADMDLGFNQMVTRVMLHESYEQTMYRCIDQDVCETSLDLNSMLNSELYIG